MKKISVCLRLDDQAEEAAAFYTSLFKVSKREPAAHDGDTGNMNTVAFELEGLPITIRSGGPLHKFSPSHSFFVWRETEKEIEALWQKLSARGKVRMGLDTYPWASQYGWTADMYGVEWQLMLASGQPQKIAPAFLFVDALFGRGEEAINFYTSVFPEAKVETMVKDEKTRSVMHSVFSVLGQNFVLMEGQGKHGHHFSPAYSFVVPCETQGEIDELRAKLTAGGSEEPSGWLKDKFGVSWQIVLQTP